MGKSPGKWIKTVLFGKKHSKSNISKNATRDEKAAAKPSAEDLTHPVISNPCQFTDNAAESMELEKGISESSGVTIDSLPVDQGLESPSNVVSVSVSDDEMRKHCQAVTKVQAVFRGFLARQAFRSLKGIIRLQALIRGHLVRRQAVATLRCMQAIVKLQALARGRRVRLSNTLPDLGEKYNMEVCEVDAGARSRFRSEKLATNAYVNKLLLSLPTAMPLSLQYDGDEPNSSSNWLERWSLSRLWEPPACPRKVSSTKHQRKQGASQLVENESGKSKRAIRKASANGDHSALASSEADKPKRNPRKVTSHQTELVQEQAQNEFERVKCSLKKVSASVTVAPETLETESEKPQQQLSSKMALNSEKEIAISSEKPADSDDNVLNKIALLEAPLKTEVTIDQVEVPIDDCPLAETQLESDPCSHDQVDTKEDESGKENKKIRKRRPLPAKQEYPENVSLNTPSLPSYMAATQSAKAKLRLQGSSKFSEDGGEVGYVRRHSLPASTNGKLNMLSPRIQKPVQANGNGISKTNKSIMSSRDDKVPQPGWRR